MIPPGFTFCSDRRLDGLLMAGPVLHSLTMNDDSGAMMRPKRTPSLGFRDDLGSSIAFHRRPPESDGFGVKKGKRGQERPVPAQYPYWMWTDPREIRAMHPIAMTARDAIVP